MKYKKTENNTWSSLLRTCEDENIELADIIIHTKYPINSERLFGFSVCTPQANVNCGLILHDYDCMEMTLDETRPPLFTEDEWEYLLPQLESNGLLGVPLNVSIASIGIQWFARCAFECLLAGTTNLSLCGVCEN